ncbi:MAG: hypothetical protein LUQ26_00480 [Methylococcaceae bacterium]|nr:hypothetical protein [Methylococcaceae bacterium]
MKQRVIEDDPHKVNLDSVSLPKLAFAVSSVNAIYTPYGYKPFILALAFFGKLIYE